MKAMPEISVRQFAQDQGTTHTTVNKHIRQIELDSGVSFGRNTGRGKARYLSEEDQRVLRTRLTTLKVTADLEQDTAGAVVYQTRKMQAPDELEIVPVTIYQIDPSLVDAQTLRNQQLMGTLQKQLRAKVLGEAIAFVGELKAEVKQTITRGVAEAYQEVI